MTYEEKFKIVISAIQEAKKFTLPIEPTKLRFTYENGLMDLSLEDITAILIQMQELHKVIFITTKANTKRISGWDPYAEEKDFFNLAITDKFEKWANSYLKDENIEKEVNSFLEDSKDSIRAIRKFWAILEEIEEKRLLAVKNQLIKIPTKLSIVGNGIVGDYESRKSIVDKLIHWDAVNNLKKITFNGRDYFKFSVSNNYKKVFGAIKNNINKPESKPTPIKHESKLEVPSTSAPIYEIKYNPQNREILLNNLLVRKPRSFGNNESVFDYLYNNPNKDWNLSEIEGAIGMQGIDLNKFVENIGFKGDIRKVFFKVSKDKIRFNNPITE